MSHLHSYQKIRGRKGYYRCIAPDCMHYAQLELIVGKKAICPKCLDPFLLTRYALSYSTVVCDFCHNSPKAKKLVKMRNMISNMEKIGFLGPLLPEEVHEDKPPENKAPTSAPTKPRPRPNILLGVDPIKILAYSSGVDEPDELEDENKEGERN